MSRLSSAVAVSAALVLVVANDTAEERSYGGWLTGGATDERDEASGLPTCDYPRNLAGVTCE